MLIRNEDGITLTIYAGYATLQKFKILVGKHILLSSDVLIMSWIKPAFKTFSTAYNTTRTVDRMTGGRISGFAANQMYKHFGPAPQRLVNGFDRVASNPIGRQIINHLGREVLEDSEELLSVHKWADEKDRLNELYYCILQRVIKRDPIEVRALVNILDSLGLLDPGSISEAKIVGGNGKGDDEASLIKAIMVRAGIDNNNADKFTSALCRIARGLQTRYDGKIQKFLREWGAKMADDLNKTISTKNEIAEDDMKYGIIQWLQNAVEMPVPLPSASTDSREFFEGTNTKESDLVEFADETDLNIALLDDLRVMSVKSE